MSNVHLRKLKDLITPLDPVTGNLVDWKMAEDTLGICYPSDFKEFVYTYGNAIWFDLFRPIYPDTDTIFACEKSKDRITGIFSSMYASKIYDRDGRQVNIPPYPNAEGLLPCLLDTNSDIVCWWTKGSPDHWTTVVFQEGNLFFYPFSITQLIYDWIEQIPPASEVWGMPDSNNFGITY